MVCPGRDLLAEARRQAFRKMFEVAVAYAVSGIEAAAIELGYLEADDPPAYRAGIVALLRSATEPV